MLVREPLRGTNALWGIQGRENDDIQRRVRYHLASVFRLQSCFCPIRQVRHIRLRVCTNG